MKVKYILNSCQVSAKLNRMPISKIVHREKLDRNHEEIVFDFSSSEKWFCDKLLSKKGIICND